MADNLDKELAEAKIGEEVWRLLWPYIADENADEDFGEEMAQRLCEDVLPEVWNEAGKIIDDLLALVRYHKAYVEWHQAWGNRVLPDCITTSAKEYMRKLRAMEAAQAALSDIVKRMLEE